MFVGSWKVLDFFNQKSGNPGHRGQLTDRVQGYTHGWRRSFRREPTNRYSICSLDWATQHCG